MTTDEEFAADIADTVALVARGDIAAFAIPGQETRLDAAGAHRFGVVYAELARAATSHQRTVVLQWMFDPPGAAAAALRSEANAALLLGALEPFAVNGHLPALVRVEFVNVGAVSAALRARLVTIGVVCS